MSEPIKNETNEPTETVAMQLIMTIDGQLKVVGPLLNDKTACYGLLELAKDAIREMHQPKIVKAGGMMNFVRNGRH